MWSITELFNKTIQENQSLVQESFLECPRISHLSPQIWIWLKKFYQLQDVSSIQKPFGITITRTNENLHQHLMSWTLLPTRNWIKAQVRLWEPCEKHWIEVIKIKACLIKYWLWWLNNFVYGLCWSFIAKIKSQSDASLKFLWLFVKSLCDNVMRMCWRNERNS